MSESALVIEDPAIAPNSSSIPSAGAMLRMAREAQGLHVDTLAVAMKIPVKKLEALETDRYDLLPDTVFTRALASSICRTLKIDPEPVLEKLPSSIAPRLKTDESGINTPFRVANEGLGGGYFDQLSKPVVLAVLTLLVGVLVVTFFPFGTLTEVIGEVKPDGTGVTSIVSQTPDSRTDQLGDAAPTLNSSLSISIPVEPTTAVAAVPESASPAAVVTQPAPDKAAEEPVIGETIGFKAKGPTWIEVVDAKGQIKLSKTFREGEVAGASGELPLKVVIGHAENTEVQVRGKLFDLANVAKNNVARFEVK